eukprot:g14499.t1
MTEFLADLGIPGRRIPALTVPKPVSPAQAKSPSLLPAAARAAAATTSSGSLSVAELLGYGFRIVDSAELNADKTGIALEEGKTGSEFFYASPQFGGNGPVNTASSSSMLLNNVGTTLTSSAMLSGANMGSGQSCLLDRLPDVRCKDITLGKPEMPGDFDNVDQATSTSRTSQFLNKSLVSSGHSSGGGNNSASSSSEGEAALRAKRTFIPMKQRADVELMRRIRGMTFLHPYGYELEALASSATVHLHDPTEENLQSCSFTRRKDAVLYSTVLDHDDVILQKRNSNEPATYEEKRFPMSAVNSKNRYAEELEDYPRHGAFANQTKTHDKRKDLADSFRNQEAEIEARLQPLTDAVKRCMNVSEFHGLNVDMGRKTTATVFIPVVRVSFDRTLDQTERLIPRMLAKCAYCCDSVVLGVRRQVSIQQFSTHPRAASGITDEHFSHLRQKAQELGRDATVTTPRENYRCGRSGPLGFPPETSTVDANAKEVDVFFEKENLQLTIEVLDGEKIPKFATSGDFFNWLKEWCMTRVYEEVELWKPLMINVLHTDSLAQRLMRKYGPAAAAQAAAASGANTATTSGANNGNNSSVVCLPAPARAAPPSDHANLSGAFTIPQFCLKCRSGRRLIPWNLHEKQLPPRFANFVDASHCNSGNPHNYLYMCPSFCGTFYSCCAETHKLRQEADFVTYLEKMVEASRSSTSVKPLSEDSLDRNSPDSLLKVPPGRPPRDRRIPLIVWGSIRLQPKGRDEVLEENAANQERVQKAHVLLNRQALGLVVPKSCMSVVPKANRQEMIDASLMGLDANERASFLQEGSGEGQEGSGDGAMSDRFAGSIRTSKNQLVEETKNYKPQPLMVLGTLSRVLDVNMKNLRLGLQIRQPTDDKLLFWILSDYARVSIIGPDEDDLELMDRLARDEKAVISERDQVVSEQLVSAV